MLAKIPDPNEPLIKSLEEEIDSLEIELSLVESQINAFENEIRNQLSYQILRIKELKVVYKNQKQEKKVKRLEQKKKGKNYKEPVGLKKTADKNIQNNSLNSIDQQELKRLYKEAIVVVHPDKFANESDEQNERAHNLTIQLIDLYKSGDLEELKDFHEHIISGNALSHISFRPETIVNPLAMVEHLKKKRNELANNLATNKKSQLYNVLTSYESPSSFIAELQVEFDLYIKKLERRTK